MPGGRHEKYIKLLRAVSTIGMASVISYLITVFLAPFVTKQIGVEAYGYVKMAKDFALYAVYATSALNAYTVRHITVSYHNREYGDANRYFNSVYYGDLFVASVIFAGLCVFTVFMGSVLHVPDSELTDIRLLFLFAGTKYLISTAYSAYEASAYVTNRLWFSGTAKIIAYLAEAVVLYVLYSCCRPMAFYAGIGMLCGDVIITAANVYLCRKYTPEIKRDIHMFSFKTALNLTKEGIWALLNNTGHLLSKGLDTAVCSVMLGSTALGYYSVSEVVPHIAITAYAVPAKAFRPIFLKDYSSKNPDILKKDMKFAMCMTAMFTNLMFAGFLCLGRVYYRLWMPEQNGEMLYRMTLLSMVPSLIAGPVSPLYYAYTLKVKAKIPALVTLASGVLNVTGMYFLIRYTGLGVYAVILTTVVLVGSMNLFFHPPYAAYVLGMPKSTFYPCLVRNLLSCLILCAFFRLLGGLWMPSGWAGLAGTIFVYVITGAAIHTMVTIGKRGFIRMSRMVRKRKNQ